MTTIPRARVNSFGVPGPRGATGPAGPAGPGRTTTAVSATGTVAAADGETVEHVTIASSEITRTLPAAETTGQIVTIQDQSGKAGEFPIHIAPQSGDTIDGGPGTYTLDQDFGSASFARTSGGDWVNFADGRQWRGVEVGKYLTYADGNLPNAMIRAKQKNPNEKKLILPAGEWAMSQVTEAAGALGDNMIVDGGDRDRCILYRTATGQMLLWQNAPSNVVVRNVTFEFREISGQFSASVNAVGATNFLLEDCAFSCTIPDSVTTEGIRHQIQFSGSNITVRRCKFFQSQLRLSNLGESIDGARCYGNDFENPCDLGVSCVGGDGSSDYIRNVEIFDNRFFGTLMGSGCIYVGSDAASANPDNMSDVDIYNNHINVAFGQLGADAGTIPGSRIAIYIVLCELNKRLKMRDNVVFASNNGYASPLSYGMAMYLRNGVSTSTVDARIEGNTVDWYTDDPHEGILVDGPSISEMHLNRNTVRVGTRGLKVGATSKSEINDNIVTGTGALILDSTYNAINDVAVRGNHFDASGSFQSSIQLSGNHNMTQIVAEQNTLRTATGSAAVNSLTGGATLDYSHNLNGQTAGLSGTITATQNVDNRTIV